MLVNSNYSNNSIFFASLRLRSCEAAANLLEKYRREAEEERLAMERYENELRNQKIEDLGPSEAELEAERLRVRLDFNRLINSRTPNSVLQVDSLQRADYAQCTRSSANFLLLRTAPQQQLVAEPADTMKTFQILSCDFFLV